MRRLFLLIGSVIAMTLLLQAIGVAQNQPLVPAPMAPIAQWPPATPWAQPANNGNANQAGATTPPEPNVNTSVTQAQALGADNFGGISSAYDLSGGQLSLAEAARQARQRLAKDRPRVFTNNDIARLRQAAGEPPMGVMPAGRPATSEQTMPASDVTAPAPTANPNNTPNATPDNGMQNNVPASDQTTPPAPNTQTQPKRSPFRPKQ